MLFLLVIIISIVSSTFSIVDTDIGVDCVHQGEQYCNALPNCAAFGVYGDQIQLHSCNITVANKDWAIYVKESGGVYKRLPGSVNVDEKKCSQPYNGSQMTRQCIAPPPQQHYNISGVIDVFTFENTLFYWNKKMYVLENIPCSYWEHAGIWDSQFENHSYARVREFLSGRVIVNITSTIKFGFISAFTDYSHGTVWLFGTQYDRCGGPSKGDYVQAWWSKDLIHWSTADVFDYGKTTHNIQVTKVGPMGPTIAAPMPVGGPLPPHRYIMYLECFAWAINNNEDGNLTYGWELINSTAPHAPCGGPSMRYNPTDKYYYILTGGHHVELLRTQDFHTWQTSTPSPFLQPSANDTQVAPYCNFAAEASIKGSPPRGQIAKKVPFVPYWRDNWKAWDKNSNDADICCMHPDLNVSYVIWGVSTQGRAPSPPLTGHDAGANAVAVANMPLDKLLMAYF